MNNEVINIEVFENLQLEYTISVKLKEAEMEISATDVRLDFDEISKEMRELLVEKLQNRTSVSKE